MRTIDADELKRAACVKFYTTPYYKHILDLIDHAPTVKFSLMPADETKEDAYKRGYKKGKVDGLLKANARPQGEWKLISMGLTNKYQCSLCGRTISPMYSPMLITDYPFCHCGAKMVISNE